MQGATHVLWAVSKSLLGSSCQGYLRSLVPMSMQYNAVPIASNLWFQFLTLSSWSKVLQNCVTKVRHKTKFLSQGLAPVSMRAPGSCWMVESHQSLILGDYDRMQTSKGITRPRFHTRSNTIKTMTKRLMTHSISIRTNITRQESSTREDSWWATIAMRELGLVSNHSATSAKEQVLYYICLCQYLYSKILVKVY